MANFKINLYATMTVWLKKQSKMEKFAFNSPGKHIITRSPDLELARKGENASQQIRKCIDREMTATTGTARKE
jgi:hypothetical protein